jgi:uncharacterized membrane protein YtjA (UPF0391 family)
MTVKDQPTTTMKTKLVNIDWFEGSGFPVQVRTIPGFAINQPWKGFDMLSWTLAFLVIALLAGLLGFAGIAGAAAGIAKILFVVFLVLFLISLVTGRRRV